MCNGKLTEYNGYPNCGDSVNFNLIFKSDFI